MCENEKNDTYYKMHIFFRYKSLREMNVKYKTRIHILGDREMEGITRDVDCRVVISQRHKEGL